MAKEVPVDVAAKALRIAGGPATKRVLSKAMREVSIEGKSRVADKWRKQRIRPSKANSVVGRRATQTDAKVTLRGSKFPYAAGVEFGSIQFRQFRPWVGNAATGATWRDMYVLGSTLVEYQEHDAAVVFADALEKLLEDHL